MSTTPSPSTPGPDYRALQNRAFDEEVAVLRAQGMAARFGYQENLDDALAAYGRHPTWQRLAAARPDWTGAAVLDYGAGRGLAGRLLARRGARVVAVDMNDSAVAGLGALRGVTENVQPVAAMFEALPIANQSLDAVVCRWVLHHCGDLPLALKELHRVLKPGGLLLAQAEPLLPLHWPKEKFLAFHRTHFFSEGVHENADRPWGYRRALRQAGFDVTHLAIEPPPAPASWRGRWHRLWGHAPRPHPHKGYVQDPRLLFTPLDITLIARKKQVAFC